MASCLAELRAAGAVVQDIAVRDGSRRMLVLVSVGYFLSVWAWGLLSPLAPLLREDAGLDAAGQALVVALPVLVGCLGRVPVGALADRFGGRAAFLAALAVSIVALAGLAAGGYRTAGGLLAGSALLGVAGTTFAAGVQVVSGWFPGPGRGLAVGVLGMGVCGSAAGGLTAVRWAGAYGMAVPFVVSAVLLALCGVALAVLGRDAPAGSRRTGGLSAALRLPITWRASGWYAVQFGVFVAFSVYLPVYLGNAYGLPAADAGTWMAAFVVVAVLARPIGGWLADRVPGRPLVVSLAALAVVAGVQAFTPPLPVVAVTLLAMAVALGVASSATLVRAAAGAGPSLVGLVTGLVTAAAGLAGFASPLLMAASYAVTGGYGAAVGLLAVAAAVAAWSAARPRRGARPT
ncbi:MFS transporter [Actinoplanes sp. CA-030573]|uniref:MFS transporter n=1 Tax=Actinoplanes sp. CA-030573 TaxID=3239898 RepID=UPI003D8D7F1D